MQPSAFITTTEWATKKKCKSKIFKMQSFLMLYKINVEDANMSCIHEHTTETTTHLCMTTEKSSYKVSSLGWGFSQYALISSCCSNVNRLVSCKFSTRRQYSHNVLRVRSQKQRLDWLDIKNYSTVWVYYSKIVINLRQTLNLSIFSKSKLKRSNEMVSIAGRWRIFAP